MVKVKKTSDPWWSRVDVINILSTIIGIRPVYDRPKNDGSKYSVIGIMFAIGHTIIGAFIFHKKYLQLILRSENRVLFGTHLLQSINNLLVPFFISVCAVLQFSAMSIYLNKLDRLDKSMENNRVNFSEFKKYKIRVLKITHCLLLIYAAFSTGMAI